MSKLLENIYSECFNPIKQKVYDPIDKCYVVRYVPCGKCYHCKITKVNEWCTRMVVQSMYSKYCYFGTLTYDSTDSKIFEDTMPLLSNINKRKKFVRTPLLLCKPHLQNFFKRLRKHSKIKFQYYACGELGKNYGRPHYHFILWSNSPLDYDTVAYSWSTIDNSGKRVLIGRIDFQDLKKDARNAEHSYKYVCKYLQKSNFNPENLPTYELHKKNLKEYIFKNCHGVQFTKELYNEMYKQYFEMVRPFSLCSKRPAIGFEYLQEHLGEYAKGNFKLFGLHGKYIFPTYYYRKTKEYLCPYKTISAKNGLPCTYSNIPTVASMLVELQNAIAFNEGFLSNTPIVQFDVYNDSVRFPCKGYADGIRLPIRYFNFYDCKNKYYYYLRGDGDYDVCVNKYTRLYKIPAKDLINDLMESYKTLLNSFLYSMHEISKLKRKCKDEEILLEFGSYENYLSQRSELIDGLLSIIEQNQKLYDLRKIDF